MLSPASFTLPARPLSTCHESTPMQIPCVDRPPPLPLIVRQGQIGSQLQASR
jgi:hypothetical protein